MLRFCRVEYLWVWDSMLFIYVRRFCLIDWLFGSNIWYMVGKVVYLEYIYLY